MYKEQGTDNWLHFIFRFGGGLWSWTTNESCVFESNMRMFTEGILEGKALLI